jgi:high-affinity Fe2+/Pb2+ permease
MPENLDNSQFALGRKWFWVGIVTALFLPAGLVYGISLAAEKDRRKEGFIIIAFAIVWFFVLSLWLLPWLKESGFTSSQMPLKTPRAI